MLEHIFGSKTRVKIFSLFFKNTGQRYYVRQIARITKSQLNAVRREIENLEDFGIIRQAPVAEAEPAGSRPLTKASKPAVQEKQKKYYCLNTDFVLYHELRSLMLKSQILLEKDLIKRIQNISRLQLFILSGVFVGREDAPTDMLLVGQVEKKNLLSLLKKFEREFNRVLRYTIMTPLEYKYRREITDRFLYDILENKKVVITDKLHRSAKDREPA